MKAVTVRDVLKRKLVESKEEQKRGLKALKFNRTLQMTTWSRIKLGANSYFKVRNRCIITGRGKAVNKAYKLSRHEFRRMANLSKLPGLEKASW